MKTIYKYALNRSNSVTVIEAPKGARFLSVAVQSGAIVIWAEVDVNADLENRAIYTIGTGYPLPDGDLSFIGTVLTHNGALVHHVYELLPCATACQSA